MTTMSLLASLIVGVLAQNDEWRPVGKLILESGSKDDDFGAGVVLSDGDLFIGVPGEDTAKANAGSVNVYRPENGSWSLAQTLTTADPQLSQSFGVAIAVDGSTLVGGAPGRDVWEKDSGAAYVFERTNEGWAQTAMLVPQFGRYGDLFGAHVAIEGDLIVASSPGPDYDGPSPGFACIYERVGGQWTLAATLMEDMAQDRSFGDAVAILDGSVFVSATTSSIEDQGGSISVFEKQAGYWQRTARVAPADITNNDRFGHSLAAEGGRLFVGNIGDPMGDFTGSVHVIERVEGEWTRTARLMAPDAAKQQVFGRSVSAVGKSLVVGSRRYRCGWEVTAHVFHFEADQWNPTQLLVPWEPSDYSTFGPSVAISDEFLVVGDSYDDVHGIASGSAFVYSLTAPLPCPGDLNHDGALDLFDVLAFLNLRRLGECDADLNGDDRIDLFDFLTLQNAFAEGCLD